MNNKKQAKLDKAVKGMLNLGALPPNYKRPKATLKDKDRKFKLDARPGKEKIVDVED